MTVSTTWRISVLGSKVTRDVSVGVHSLPIASAPRGVSHPRQGSRLGRCVCTMWRNVLLHTCCDTTPTCENATLHLWLSSCHVRQCYLFAGYGYHDELLSFLFCSRNVIEKLELSLKNIPILGKMEGRRKGDDRGWDGWMAFPTRREFEQTPGDGEEQGSLACCSAWGHKKSDSS